MPREDGFRKVSTTVLRSVRSDYGDWAGRLRSHTNLTNHQIVIVASGVLDQGLYAVEILPDTENVSNAVDTGKTISLEGKDSAIVTFSGVIAGLKLRAIERGTPGFTISVVISSYARNRRRRRGHRSDANPDSDYVSSTLFTDKASNLNNLSRNTENHRNLIYHQLTLHAEDVVESGEYRVRFIPDDDQPLETSVDTGKTLVFNDNKSAFAQFGGVLRGIHLQPVTVASSGTTLTGTLSSSVERFDEIIYQYIGTAPELGDHVSNFNNPHQTSWDNLLNKPLLFPPDEHTHYWYQINDRVANFRGDWEAGIYVADELVWDRPYTMQANKQTADRAAPQPVGSDLGTLGQSLFTAQYQNNDYAEFQAGDAVEFLLEEWTTATNTSQVWSGHDYVFEDDGLIRTVQIWVPEVGATIEHRVVVMVNPSAGIPRYEVYYPSNLIVGAWNEIELPDIMVRRGDTVRIYIDVSNETTATASYGNWLFEGATTENPSPQSWNHMGQAVLRVHEGTSDTGFDVELTSTVKMEAELGSVVEIDIEIAWLSGLIALDPSAILRFQDVADTGKYLEYRVVRGPIDQGDYVELHVSVHDVGESGPTIGANTELLVTVPTLGAVKYVRSPDNWLVQQPVFASVTSYLAYNGVEQVISDNDAHGIEMAFLKHYWSDDWDIVHAPT